MFDRMYTMKRLMGCLGIVIVLGWSAPAAAINAKPVDEKKKEDKTTKQEAKPAQETAPPASTTRPAARRQSQEKLLNNLKQQVRESQKNDNRKYDHYIDKNKDGVDDRVSPGSRSTKTPDAVSAPKRQPASEPDRVQPAAPDTSRSARTRRKPPR